MQGRKIAFFVVILIGQVSIACSPADSTYRQYKELEAVARQGEVVYKQYKTSDYATAKAALSTYIKDLEELIKANHPEAVAFQMDVLISCVRLAKLEESNNRSEKAFYMKQAEVQCGLLKPTEKDCSQERLRNLVDTMDQVEPK